jgi:endoglucanase
VLDYTPLTGEARAADQEGVRKLALLVTLAAAILPAGSSAEGPRPLALHVQGHRLVDAAGRPVRLLGVDRAGAEYACVQGWGLFDGPTDDRSVAAIRAWKANAVRLPLNESCWLGAKGVDPRFGGERYRAAIAGFVARLHRAGIYAILDLHWSSPGARAATTQQAMADAAHAPAFWRSVATRFRSDPAVVFDLYNEPHDVSWDCWRSGCVAPGGLRAAGMQQLVDAVRSARARQPIMLTGLRWGNDLGGWLAHRPSDPRGQLVAGFHVYDFNSCANAACWDATVAPIARSVPVVTGELGQRGCAHGFVDRFMRWADPAGVSYLGWGWNTADCSGFPALIADFSGRPTRYGAGLRAHLAALDR